mgnify:FL=1
MKWIGFFQNDDRTGCDDMKKNNRILAWFTMVLLAFAIPYVGTRLFVRYRDVSDARIAALSSSRDVCILQNGNYRLIDCEEYILYVLAGLYDPSWNVEMTKTMAVLTRTAIYYEMNDQADTANGGGKIINEGDLKEIRIEKDELKQKWGKEYTQNMEMVYQAVKDTMGQVIVYDGRLIIPVSHAVSIGVTVSAEELYGTAIPYLVSVDSSQDIQSPEFSSTKIYSALRIKKEFGMNGEGEAFDGSESLGQTGEVAATVKDGGEKNKSETAGSAQNEEQVIDADALTVLEATKSGFVRKVNVFGTVVTGETFAQTLSLGTTNFHIDQVEEGYRIISIGKGSSLGMSLYGAGWKADQGSTYREIIAYYYPETSIADGAAY